MSGIFQKNIPSESLARHQSVQMLRHTYQTEIDQARQGISKTLLVTDAADAQPINKEVLYQRLIVGTAKAAIVDIFRHTAQPEADYITLSDANADEIVQAVSNISALLIPVEFVRENMARLVDQALTEVLESLEGSTAEIIADAPTGTPVVNHAEPEEPGILKMYPDKEPDYPNQDELETPVAPLPSNNPAAVVRNESGKLPVKEEPPPPVNHEKLTWNEAARDKLEEKKAEYTTRLIAQLSRLTGKTDVEEKVTAALATGKPVTLSSLLEEWDIESFRYWKDAPMNRTDLEDTIAKIAVLQTLSTTRIPVIGSGKMRRMFNWQDDMSVSSSEMISELEYHFGKHFFDQEVMYNAWNVIAAYNEGETDELKRAA